MNILYTTNDSFADKVGASICSVYENNKAEEELFIYIIGQGLKENSKKRFRNLATRYKREIVFIDAKDMKEYFDFQFDTSGWNQVILLRLLIDRLLPDTLNRIIYLDGDTINLRRLKPLWEINLKGKTLGACIEATVDQKRKKKLGLESIPYINSGVLVFDLQKWKDRNCCNRIIEYFKKCGGHLFATDQDAINAVLKDEIYYLPPKYNFYNIYWFYPYRVLKKLMGSTYYYDKETFYESVNRPVVIHYLGEERPWRRGNKHKYRRDYEKYFVKTPWKNEKTEETGWEIYFICWNIFNIVIKPFPMLRYRIINGLIPYFINWRRKQLEKK